MAAGRPRPRTFPSIRSHHPALRPNRPQGTGKLSGEEGKGRGLGGLFQDQEQLFLLMLAVLLIKNGAQMEIVLALLYIAM